MPKAFIGLADLNAGFFAKHDKKPGVPVAATVPEAEVRCLP